MPYAPVLTTSMELTSKKPYTPIGVASCLGLEITVRTSILKKSWYIRLKIKIPTSINNK